MACTANVLHRLIWVRFMSMLSMYVQSGTHRHFHWRIIAVLTQNPTVLMFVDNTGAPKLYRKYVETLAFVAVSEKWPPGENIRGSCYWWINHGVITDIRMMFPQSIVNKLVILEIHTHTHNIYRYILYICVCVCVLTHWSYIYRYEQHDTHVDLDIWVIDKIFVIGTCHKSGAFKLMLLTILFWRTVNIHTALGHT